MAERVPEIGRESPKSTRRKSITKEDGTTAGPIAPLFGFAF
jgi:hypothetical protein